MNAKKKPGVLVVCPVYEPHAGGGGQYFPLLVSQLKAHPGLGDVAVLTERHPQRPMVADERGATIYRLLPRRDTMEHKSKMYSTLSFLLTYALLYFFVPILMWRHRAEVLHYTRYLRRAFYALAWMLKSWAGKTIILDMRATVEDALCIRQLFGYSAVISNSMGVYQQMDALGVDKARHFFVPNPVRFPTPLSEDDAWQTIKKLSSIIRRPYLAFIGQLLERKSITEVLDAFAAFSRTHPEYQLVLAGRNMMGTVVDEKIQNNPAMVYLGPITRDEVIAVMQGAEMILQPSRVEGIPRVSLEALSLGKKVLLPPCVPELIEGNALFTVEEISAQCILMAIDRILLTPGRPKYDLSIHDPDRSRAVLESVYEKARC